MYVPGKVFFTKGVGHHDEEIASFEMALRDAGIAPYNIVPVSSILPPTAEIVEAREGVQELRDGMVVHAVLSRCSSQEGGVASALGVARGDGMGYIIERCSREPDRDLGSEAERIARELLGEESMESFDLVASTNGGPEEWATAVAAAVFVE